MIRDYFFTNMLADVIQRDLLPDTFEAVID